MPSVEWRSPLTPGALWMRWSVATLAGEVIGFGLVGVLAFYIATSIPEDHRLLTATLIVAAGAIEGIALGTAQTWVLQRALHDGELGEWVVATTGGALAGWALGMPFGQYASESGMPASALPFAALGLLLVMGTVMGWLQWLVLRRHVGASRGWILASAVAWSVGLVPAYAMVSLLGPEHPTWLVVAVTAAAGLLMGALVGIITGAALVRIVARGRPAEIVLSSS